MPDYMRVKIIEQDEQRCQWLTGELDADKHTLVVHGDGSDLSLLAEEGVQTTEAFLALTDDTESNILSAWE